MSENSKSTVVRLSDTGLALSDPQQDVRGRKVVDRDGEEIGDVDGLLIDEAVHVDLARERVAESVDYDPELVQARGYYEDIYAYYGYSPFWGAGYVYPPNPFR